MEKGKAVWLYDIFLEHGFLVGTQGDYEFDSEEEAERDAKDYILNGLKELYGKQESDFKIKCYQITG